MEFDTGTVGNYGWNDFACNVDGTFVCSRPCPTPAPTLIITTTPTENPTSLPTAQPMTSEPTSSSVVDLTQTPTSSPTLNATINTPEPENSVENDSPLFWPTLSLSITFFLNMVLSVVCLLRRLVDLRNVNEQLHAWYGD